jgi:hypothetical protein
MARVPACPFLMCLPAARPFLLLQPTPEVAVRPVGQPP